MSSCIVAEGYGQLPKCGACKHEIIGGTIISMKDGYNTTVMYHSGCSRCWICQGYVPDTNYKFRLNKLMCRPCYGAVYWPRCALCNLPMDQKATLQVLFLRRASTILITKLFFYQVFDRKIHLSCYKCANCCQIMNPLDRQYMVGTGMFCTIDCANEKRLSEFKASRAL